MAGNSLTEAVVFGRRAGLAMTAEAGERAAPEPAGGSSSVEDAEGWRTLRRAMTEGAGLIRTEKSLAETEQTAREILSTTDDVALAMAATAAELICRGASSRDESRGVHFRSDHPERSPSWDGRHQRMSIAERS
jgi:L-aspartate oxidase